MSQSQEIPILTPEESPLDEHQDKLPLALPIDKWDGFLLSLDLIKSRRPELSPAEVTDLAVSLAGAVTFLENRRADIADMARQIDLSFHN